MAKRRKEAPTTTTGAKRGCYTVKQVCETLKISRRSFDSLRQRGELPMLEELRPRLGRRIRYRADLIERYLAAGLWTAEHREELRRIPKRQK
jgi:hypothetical protein